MRKNSTVASFSDRQTDDDHDANSREEQKASGSVKLSTYKQFFASAENVCLVVVVFIAFIGAQFAWSASDYFLSEW